VADGPDRPEGFFRHELLTTTEVSEFLRIAADTLKYWRRRKERRGPRFIKLHAHAVRYRLADLERFLDSRTVDPRPELKGPRHRLVRYRPQDLEGYVRSRTVPVESVLEGG
jgi:predicted DNA-binding transcriptional regulator AlpA